jgi:site-specific recombinase XerD
MERKTFSISFLIRRSKLTKNLEAPVIMRITVNGARTEVAIQRSIAPDEWNSQKGCAKTRTQYGRILNEYLDQIRLRVFRCQQDLRFNGKAVTATAVKEGFMGEDIEENHTLVNLYTEHNADLKVKVNNGVSQNTFKRHETSLRHVREFIQLNLNVVDIDLKKVDHAFIRSYETFLRTTRKCNNNSTVKYIKNLGKVIREAMNRDWIVKDPFRHIKFHLEEVDKPFLNNDELNAVIRKKIAMPRIAQVRDTFVFCCFTGLAYVDAKSLRPDDIEKGVDGNLWIRKQRHKSKQWAHIPLLPVPKDIINRYASNIACIKKGVLLPVLSNQKMNAYLKEVADLCGISKNLTTHCARHTFATTVTLANSISMESVSKMLGHSSLNMTKKYARILDTTIGREMDQLAKKMGIQQP